MIDNRLLMLMGCLLFVVSTVKAQNGNMQYTVTVKSSDDLNPNDKVFVVLYGENGQNTELKQLQGIYNKFKGKEEASFTISARPLGHLSSIKIKREVNGPKEDWSVHKITVSDQPVPVYEFMCACVLSKTKSLEATLSPVNVINQRPKGSTSASPPSVFPPGNSPPGASPSFAPSPYAPPSAATPTSPAPSTASGNPTTSVTTASEIPARTEGPTTSQASSQKKTYYVEVTTDAIFNPNDKLLIKFHGKNKAETDFKEFRHVYDKLLGQDEGIFSINGTDVGDIESITLKRVVGGPIKELKIEKILVVEHHDKDYEFECKCKLSQENGHQITLTPTNVVNMKGQGPRGG